MYDPSHYVSRIYLSPNKKSQRVYLSSNPFGFPELNNPSKPIPRVFDHIGSEFTDAGEAYHRHPMTQISRTLVSVDQTFHKRARVFFSLVETKATSRKEREEKKKKKRRTRMSKNKREARQVSRHLSSRPQTPKRA